MWLNSDVRQDSCLGTPPVSRALSGWRIIFHLLHEFSYVLLTLNIYRKRFGAVRFGAGFGVLLFVCVDLAPPCGATGLASLELRCTNPASGANWVITVDLDRQLVDSLPATITDKWISWHEPNRGFFDLERATGKLQFRNASSTGGYFLHYTCQLA
jgi:hypothetical protein